VHGEPGLHTTVQTGRCSTECNAAFHFPEKSEVGPGNDVTPVLTAVQLTSRKTKMDALFDQSINHLAHNNLACKAL